MEGENPTGPLDAVKLVSLATAAEYLGVSKMTVHRMCRRGELDSVKVSLRSIRIPMPAITEYIEAHRNGQSPEVA